MVLLYFIIDGPDVWEGEYLWEIGMTGEGLERGLTCGQGDISDGDMDIFMVQSQTMNGEWRY